MESGARMNGRGIQAFIEAILVIISEIVIWVQDRPGDHENSDKEDD